MFFALLWFSENVALKYYLLWLLIFGGTVFSSVTKVSALLTSPQPLLHVGTSDWNPGFQGGSVEAGGGHCASEKGKSVQWSRGSQETEVPEGNRGGAQRNMVGNGCGGVPDTLGMRSSGEKLKENRPTG